VSFGVDPRAWRRLLRAKRRAQFCDGERFRPVAKVWLTLVVAVEPNDDMGSEARSVESGFSSPLSSVDGEYEGRRKLYALA